MVTKSQATRFETAIDINSDTREQMVTMLNQHLADITDLHAQTKHAHWNVRGIHFQQFHELFDLIAEPLPEFVDMVAERIGQLGGYATGTTRMAANATSLPEFPMDVTDGEGVLNLMVERWAHVAAAVRKAIDEADEAGDMATSDMMTEISRAVDKSLWFLEAHVQ